MWTKPLPYDIALGFSTPYLVMMEGDSSAWKYMNEVEDRGMALAFEAEFKDLREHERHAIPGHVDGEHSIVVEAIRLSETTRTECCEGTRHPLQTLHVHIDCIYRAPGMSERKTILITELEHLRRKEKKGGVVCKVKNVRNSFKDLVIRGADKAFERYASVWHKHRKRETKKAKKAAKE